jgi:predicted O-methyltransferase YrrM
MPLRGAGDAQAAQEVVMIDERKQPPDDREEWLRRTRREWFAVMRPLGAWVPWDVADLALDDREVPDYFRAAPRLDARHLRNCRIVPDRVELLKSCLPKHGVVAEVGTGSGAFAELILTHTTPTELHLIDRSVEAGQREVFAAARAAGTLRLHASDSAAALRAFSNGYFDWLYIDADHSYEGVKRDIAEATRVVKPAGLLVFNDYVFWSHREFMPYGVVQAVNELCRDEGWEFVYLALHPEMYCDVVIRRL